MENQRLQQDLASIVAARSARLPTVQSHLERIDAVEDALSSVRSRASNLPDAWAEDPAVRDSIGRLLDGQTLASIAQARAALKSVEARFARPTVNVGVSGRARVGKSTILQSVSGLTDDQVPTGDTRNVTAVRSRIFHASQSRAVLSMFTSEQFLEEVVQPYFTDLKLTVRPRSIDEFLGIDLLAERSRLSDSQESSVKLDRLDRLISIQRSAPRFRPFLDQGEYNLEDLDDLRRFVAYPTMEDSKADRGGEYLAVRDCRIESPFPETAVDRLGIVDLPGLGELASGIDDRIVSGLKDDVDVVLLVLRAQVGLANIDEIDIRALDLIDQARRPILDTRDFAWIVVNAGSGDETRVEDLRHHIQSRLNQDLPDSRYLMAVADGRSASSVHQQVLVPVLERLVARLPVMDHQVLDGALVALAQPMVFVQAAVDALLAAIAAARAQTGSVRGELDRLSEALRRDLSTDLRSLAPEHLGDAYVQLYVSRVAEMHKENKAWLNQGLGSFSSREAWIANARREQGVDGTLRPHAIRELHRLRVEITARYAKVEEFLNDDILASFYAEICQAIGGTGPSAENVADAQRAALLGPAGMDPQRRLSALITNLEACDPPAPGLLEAARRLAGLRFDFRLQSYPVLHDLNLNTRPRDQQEFQGGFPPDFSNPEYMYEWFLEEMTKYSFDIQAELRADASRQFKVLSGAAVLFEDEVSRSGTSSQEIRNLADGFRDELWPEKFDEFHSASARAQALRKAALALREAVQQATGGH